MRAGKSITVLALASLVALCVLGLGGCGSNGAASSNAASSGSDSAVASAEAPGAAEAAVEESGIAQEDVEGVWHVIKSGDTEMSEMEDKGLYMFYKFDADGAFTASIVAAGSSLDRVGTYKIEDGKVLVSLPEIKETSGTGAIKSISADELKDAEVVIENGVLTTDQISNDGGISTAEKITNKEYKAMLKKSKSFAAKSISVGEEVSGDFYTFTVDSFDYTSDVYPSDTSGYYTYYQHEDGSIYLLADVTYTNTGTEYAMPCYATEAIFEVDGNKYEASIEIDGGSNFSAAYEVAAKDTVRMVICAAIPESVANSGETKLTWSIPNDVEMMQTYHSYSTSNTEYELTL